MELNKNEMKEIIAKNIAVRLEPNTYVNLGVGVPTLVSKFVTDEQNINIHSENGMIGAIGDIDYDDPNYIPGVISSSGFPTRFKKGASFFDSSISFGIIRGGHLSASVLGTMEVDEHGNIANYTIPGKLVVGMGGAMDLCVGAKNVIIATYHTNNGKPKILKNCKLPLTAQKAATMIVTEKAVFDIVNEKLILSAYNPNFSIDEIISGVEPDVEISEDLEKMIME
ncbi:MULTISPECIES: succinyl-CoA--3-ketoacid-CoA transferase [Peptoniphilaceae]|jgi:butyrate-acetoacetate coA-transferase subunit B|uniref:succinyl-CoA--3-ketoacid-CoA transferase n=1 Tax=Peptoniphilaceae TaxID=1570339 RepID=UPI000288D41A|nr:MULTISPECIES: succinyl-CoA--3-ketoacid-CoA transferase [Peptoniphilus]MBS6610403.1 succinyl-CoA--3-ketoacid-CoA transferase [Peptoniphilus harei]MDU1043567.1 succinyl-CoA--3-ketoacid-CoA transferase [Peptoniphilus rhinitidis]MDU1954604.1 succinyl-CoA--3-ketoacid-CoA transferase [Peptoniphilus lacydonensis]MDU2115353.1 succinyl-CoA--3-ketoacid-CoA transferase [Peptoniphilus lacydonensis]MDU3751488.1 succinyl-CoA--3-ketoacid-CoA transferase [Peptoniphilus rhinitidis]